MLAANAFSYHQRISTEQLALTLQAPLWFPTLICAIGATLPWVSVKFSLRAMFIATTLVAVVLGAVVWASP
jgi:hypothetical protein